jgi:hypothetical protein
MNDKAISTNDTKHKIKSKYKNKVVEFVYKWLTIFKFNLFKMVFIDNIFISNCSYCDFVCEINYSKSANDNIYIQCLFCKRKFKNLAYDIEKYYDLKLQIFMTLIIILINFFVYVNFINRFSMEIIQLISIFIILDQSIIRIKNKKLNLIMYIFIGAMSYLKSYKHFIVFMCSLGSKIREVYKIRANIINKK